jgi:hypothetical protein
VNLTPEDVVRHGGEPTGSVKRLTDDDIAAALAEEPNLLACAKLLSEHHGQLVIRADLADRIAASPQLQHAHQESLATYEERIVSRGFAALHEKEKHRRAREAVDVVDAVNSVGAIQDLDPTHFLSSRGSGRARADMRFYPNDALCGARTRRGTACRRIVEPGARRCRLHGGMSTGPRTPEGRQRIGVAQKKRWERYRQERGR